MAWVGFAGGGCLHHVLCICSCTVHWACQWETIWHGRWDCNFIFNVLWAFNEDHEFGMGNLEPDVGEVWILCDWAPTRSLPPRLGYNLETIKGIPVVTGLEALPQGLARANEMHHYLANGADPTMLVTSAHGNDDDVFVI